MTTSFMTPEELREKLTQMRAGLEAQPHRDRSTDVLAWNYHDEYLSSPLWAKIKRRVLRRDAKTCRCCGMAGAHIVHHRSYDREVLEGSADDMLATVCDACHHAIHHHDDGSKRADGEWDEVLLAGRTKVVPDPPDEIPEPKIDLRRFPAAERPSQWKIMTPLQRARWSRRAEIMVCQRRIKRGHTQWANFLIELVKIDSALTAEGK